MKHPKMLEDAGRCWECEEKPVKLGPGAENEFSVCCCKLVWYSKKSENSKLELSFLGHSEWCFSKFNVLIGT